MTFFSFFCTVSYGALLSFSYNKGFVDDLAQAGSWHEQHSGFTLKTACHCSVMPYTPTFN